MTSLSDTPKKKLGRPIGSKNKRKKTTAVAAKPTPFKRPDDEKQKLIAQLTDNVHFLHQANQDLRALVHELEHRATSHRIIVSYLENKLGIKVSE